MIRKNKDMPEKVPMVSDSKSKPQDVFFKISHTKRFFDGFVFRTSSGPHRILNKKMS